MLCRERINQNTVGSSQSEGQAVGKFLGRCKHHSRLMSRMYTFLRADPKRKASTLEPCGGHVASAMIRSSMCHLNCSAAAQWAVGWMDGSRSVMTHPFLGSELRGARRTWRKRKGTERPRSGVLFFSGTPSTRVRNGWRNPFHVFWTWVCEHHRICHEWVDFAADVS